MTVKILYCPETKQLLGGQAFGQKGVDKRLDVLATALRGKLTVDDLEHLELAYSPPFGSAKDTVNIAAFCARNQSDGWVNCVNELPKSGESYQLVDVRPAPMQTQKPIPGAIKIPLNELRARLGEVDKTQPVITICAFGKASYFAARILQQHGYQVKSYGGGSEIQEVF